MNFRYWLPYGIVRTHDWYLRFRRIGFSQQKAWWASSSSRMRRALSDSRVEYLPRTMQKHLQVVVDIGSNEGQWIHSFEEFFSINHIECYEANPNVYELLKESFIHSPHVRLHNLALGHQEEDRVLNVTRASDLASLLAPTDVLRSNYERYGPEVVRKVPVRTKTLDSVMDECLVDILKLDVQGFEGSVLQGAHRTLKSTRVLLIEMNLIPHYESETGFCDLYQYITSELNFRFWNMSPPARGVDNRALWVDAVFTNPLLWKND